MIKIIKMTIRFFKRVEYLKEHGWYFNLSYDLIHPHLMGYLPLKTIFMLDDDTFNEIT